MKMRQYDLMTLGRIGALVLEGERKKEGEQWVESRAGARVANRLARFSAVMARARDNVEAYSEGEIAWEAAKAYGSFGEWSGDEIREVKQRIKGMVEDGNMANEHLAISDDVEFVFWLAAVFMAAVLE